MALSDDFTRTTAEAVAAFSAASTPEEVEAVRVAMLGRSGRAKDLQEAFRAAPGDGKRVLGPLFNAMRSAVESAWKAAQARVSARESDAPIDLTLPGPERRPGTLHPLSQLAADIEGIFTSMGFEIADGPHVESDDFNFTRLNIPPDHPARDAQDTFWLSNGKLLRTHTSSVQSRTYAQLGQAQLGQQTSESRLSAPLRRVVVGRVFRYEAVDATHDNTFTQVEGFVIDREITIAHLVGTIRTMLTAALKRDDVEVRLRPAFYPFVEPGFDVDVRSTSAPPEVRYARWMELMGCGMIHPKVLAAGGVDPDQWQGFAFGLGLERLCMIRHGITDIRVMNGADLRSLRQFA